MQGWRDVAVAAAHPVERSTEEEVELVRHGAHIHVAQSLVREASAEQLVDDHRYLDELDDRSALKCPAIPASWGRCQNGSGESRLRRRYDGMQKQKQRANSAWAHGISRVPQWRVYPSVPRSAITPTAWATRRPGTKILAGSRPPRPPSRPHMTTK